MDIQNNQEQEHNTYIQQQWDTFKTKNHEYFKKYTDIEIENIKLKKIDDKLHVTLIRINIIYIDEQYVKLTDFLNLIKDKCIKLCNNTQISPILLKITRIILKNTDSKKYINLEKLFPNPTCRFDFDINNFIDHSKEYTPITPIVLIIDDKTIVTKDTNDQYYIEINKQEIYDKGNGFVCTMKEYECFNQIQDILEKNNNKILDKFIRKGQYMRFTYDNNNKDYKTIFQNIEFNTQKIYYTKQTNATHVFCVFNSSLKQVKTGCNDDSILEISKLELLETKGLSLGIKITIAITCILILILIFKPKNQDNQENEQYEILDDIN